MTTAAAPFDPLAVPLAGTNLIEASAGTGKTWNIAELFARLVLLGVEDGSGHRRYPPADGILVVTFTKAATAELKTRLRARLNLALEALQSVPDAQDNMKGLQARCGDDSLFKLLKQALALEEQPRLVLRIQAALGGFDRAAIHTIHGFCQQVLREFPFYCGVPFDTQIDQEAARRRLLTAAQDFWRRRVSSDRDLAEAAYAGKLTPVQQLRETEHFLARPYLHERQPENPQSLREAQEAFDESWQRVRMRLDALEEAFWRIWPNLNKKIYDQKKCGDRFNRLKRQPENPDPAALHAELANSSGTNIFDASHIADKTNKGKSCDGQDLAAVSELGVLADAARRLADARGQTALRLKTELLHEMRAARERDKQQHPERTHDDSLTDVWRALQPENPHAGALAAAMAGRWRVALIDEFQDTDPLQYGIFQAAFADRGVPLFLVGDPKQAIYSFRGADIFAYLQAAGQAAQHYTLGTNRRTHRKLINGIGAFFAREAPFVLPQIEYPRVTAHREESSLNTAGSALTVRWLNRPGEQCDAGTLEQRSADWCADEIGRLLQSGALHKGSPLQAGQIAVLVRARKNGAQVQRALKRRGIQSVLNAKDSVFGEPEAEALLALLQFFLQPQRHTGLLHYVLSGCLFDYTAEQLYSLQHDQTALPQWIQAADEALGRWQRQGVYAALRQFFTQHGTEERLLARGGERTLTNLNQLMELLAEEDGKSHSPAALHRWLSHRIREAGGHSRPEESGSERTIRLESDENLVKIVTMHSSKGLQYPVVYCPFAWKGDKKNSDAWQVAHRDDGTAELLEKSQIGKDDEERIRREQLSESLRLLYVAFTRAEDRLHLYMGHYSGSKGSPAAYLSGAGETDTADAEAYRACWQAFIQRQNPEETDTAFLTGSPIPFSGSLKTGTDADYCAETHPPRRYRFDRHTSFTGLMRQNRRAEDTGLLPEMDEAEQNRQPENPAVPDGTHSTGAFSIHHFPQGTAAGICLHAVLENHRFGQSPAAQSRRSADILQRHGFDPDIWQGAVSDMLDHAAHTPLDNSGTTLAALPEDALLRETGFLLHTRRFRLDGLKHWFARQSLPPAIVQAAQQLSFYDIEGFVGGAIDLLCRNREGSVFVADYKSNRLGGGSEDYTPAALDDAMAGHHYYLQAFLYAAAAARYLRSRNALPGHIGIRYFFLRGLDGQGGGLWRWDIPVGELAPWLDG